MHNGVPPVVVTFDQKSDRNEIYNLCKEGLKKTDLVMTEDSRLVLKLSMAKDAEIFCLGSLV